jgi:hypothetical protein
MFIVGKRSRTSGAKACFKGMHEETPEEARDIWAGVDKTKLPPQYSIRRDRGAAERRSAERGTGEQPLVSAATPRTLALGCEFTIDVPSSSRSRSATGERANGTAVDRADLRCHQLRTLARQRRAAKRRSRSTRGVRRSPIQ